MRIETVREKGKNNGLVANVLYISEEEYNRLHDPKGVISSEYTSRSTYIRRSFMWSRTLCINGRMYIEGITMVIE